MSHIEETLQLIDKQLPTHTRLVAVSKYQPIEALREAYRCGQRIFGESHVQELQLKVEQMPADTEWHFIGHLQTNKVKYIAPYIALIHAVDTPRLLAEIDKQGQRCHRRIPCLLQLHLAQEETKYGFSLDECTALLEAGEWKAMQGVELRGMMCMASHVDDDAQIGAEFAHAHAFFQDTKARFFPNEPRFNLCSWGMSDDYLLAIQHGSTLVRIGSKIFGER